MSVREERQGDGEARERKGKRRDREMLLLSSYASAGYHGLLFVLADTLAK